MKPIKIALIATALFVLFGVSARADVNPIAERLKRDIAFQSWAKIPDELGGAAVPYLECMMEKSGTKRVDSGGNESPSSSPTTTDCVELRNKAASEADSKLKSMGIENLDDRRAIIFNTLLAIDLSAQGNTVWMKEAK